MEITDEVRDALNNETALRGEHGYSVQGLKIRQISAESVGILQLLGHPLYRVYEAAGRNAALPETQLGVLDLMLFVWVHSAPADDVLETALQCSRVDNSAAVRAACKYLRGTQPAALSDAVQRIVADGATRLAAAAFDARDPQKKTGGK